MAQPFYERSVDSLHDLVDELERLDYDSGVRTFGDYNGAKRQLVFVTRSPPDSYTLMVYQTKGTRGKPAPGRRLFVREFGGAKELSAFLHDLVSRPVRAFVY